MEANGRVLVVDDDPRLRRTLVDMLDVLGHEAEEAASGQEALQRLSQTRDLDLLLLDVVMPEMDGFEVVARVREDPGLRDLPIVMVTGNDTQDDRLRAVEAGANDFIPKPVDFAELCLRTGSALTVKGQQDTLKQQRSELETAHQRLQAANARLEEEVQARTGELRATLDQLRDEVA